MYFIPYKLNEYLENSFYQIPKELFVNPHYTQLSLASKTLEESIKLAKVISIYIDMQIIVEKEIFFRGGAEVYDYFKKIGIIF